MQAATVRLIVACRRRSTTVQPSEGLSRPRRFLRALRSGVDVVHGKLLVVMLDFRSLERSSDVFVTRLHRAGDHATALIPARWTRPKPFHPGADVEPRKMRRRCESTVWWDTNSRAAACRLVRPRRRAGLGGTRLGEAVPAERGPFSCTASVERARRRRRRRFRHALLDLPSRSSGQGEQQRAGGGCGAREGHDTGDVSRTRSAEWGCRHRQIDEAIGEVLGAGHERR